MKEIIDKHPKTTKVDLNDVDKPKAVGALGHYIREWRRFLDLTTYELGERAGLTPSFISQLECGRSDPSLKTLLKLELATGVPAGLILSANPEIGVPPSGNEVKRRDQNFWALIPKRDHAKVRAVFHAYLITSHNQAIKVALELYAKKKPLLSEQ